MMDVLISITGVQHIEEEQDTVELTTAGRMEPIEGGYRLLYDETAATGLEGVTTCLQIRSNEVLLERTGTMSSLLVLEKGKRHMCSYHTPYGALMMGVYTKEMENTLGEHGGELRFTYTLDMNAGLASRHDVHIVVREQH